MSTSGRVRRGLLATAVGALTVVGLPLLATAPAGAVPGTDGNPDLASGCGLDVTLVLDDSASIDSTEATQAREAAQLFADALVGTPSQLKTVVFDTRARGVAADGSLTSNLSSVVFRDPAAYTAPTSGAGQGGTNWDDGLEVARRSAGGPGDLVVFITDGDPTYRNTTTPDGHANDGSTAISGDGSTIGVAANLANPVAEATAIKAGGTHLFGIGVGLAQNGASEQRLNDVTGDEELTLSASGSVPPFGQGDYTITPNFAQLKTVVANFSRELCGHTVNVTKYLQKADGTTVQATGSTPWDFTLTLDPAPGQWNNPPGVVGPTASLTTDANGGVSFVLDQATPPDDHLGDLVETPKAGWDYNGATCSVNDFSGANPVVLFDSTGPNAPGSIGDPSELLDLPVTKGKALNCSVYNRERRPATIQVAKATVPAGQPGDFDFTLSKGQTTVDTLTGLSHGDTQTFVPVPEGTYTVTEAPAPGFVNTSATCDDLATVAAETVSASSLAVTEGQSWRCRFVNDAQSGTIRVVKQATGADGTFAFTSNVPDLGDFSLTTSSGTATTAAVTVPVGTYSIAETVPAGWDLTGATCTGGDDPASVTLSAAENVVCTFSNQAPDPSIVVAKTAVTSAVGEPGGPATYTVGVTNTSVEPVTVDSVVDSIDGGPDLDLTSVGGPVSATTCDTLVGTVLAAGGSASCTFTATVSGNGGDAVADEVTVVALDADGDEATASDGASVDITDVAPTVALTKTPSVPSISEPGGSVTYTLEVTNTGGESLHVDALRDSIEGGASFSVAAVAGVVTATTCDAVVGTDVAPGASASCTYTVVHVVDASDVPDGFVDDVARVDASDDDGEVFATAAAKVAVLDVAPTITVTKTADPTSVAETAPLATTPVTYTVEIANTSPEPVSIDSIVDAVDGGAAQPVAGSCDDLVGTSLAAGATTSCTFTLPVAGEAGDSVTDVVTVKASDDEDNQATDQDDAAVAFTDVASSLEVTKVASTPTVPEPGGPVTFLVTVANTSATDDVTIGSVVDSVDGGAPFAAGGSCPDLVGDVLVPGQSTQCSFTLDVTGEAGDAVPDTVTVSGTDDDGGSVSDSADESVAITDVASSIQVTKVADVDSVPEPGGPVSYTVTVTNTSATDDVAIASVTDSVDGGAAVAAGGTCPDLVGDLLAPGDDASCAFTLPVAGEPGDVVADTVTVTGIDDDGGPVSDSADESVAITGVASSIQVTKVADVDSVPEPGGPVSYTVTVANTSTTDTVTIDSVADAVDGGAPFAAGGDCPDLVGDALTPGQSTQCSFTLPVAGQPGDVVADTVTVTGTDDDDGPVSDSADESVAITGVASSIQVTKVADVASVPEPGGPVTYTVTVANTSPVDAVTIDSITDSVDGGAASAAGGTCPDLLGDELAVGESTSCEFTMLVLGQAGDSVGDTVVVTGTDDDDAEVTAQGSETVDVSDVRAAIEVTKVADVASVPEPGGPVTYTVTVANTSEVDAVTIDSVTDAVAGGAPFAAGGDCPGLVGDLLLAGGSTSCSFTLDVSGEPGDSVADTVTVTGTDDDDVAVSGQGSESVDVTGIASSLQVTKSADVASVPEPGGPVTYTVTVTNTSDVDAVTIDSVVDSVEGGAPFAAGGDCPGLVGDVLEPGDATSCSFAVPVLGAAGAVVDDTVTVAGTDDDDQPVSASGDESVVVTDVGSALQVTKVADVASVPEPGGPVAYTVTVANTSEVDAVTIDSVTDAVEGGAPFAAGGDCPGLVGDVLVPGGSTSCTFTLGVAGAPGDVVDDTVTVAGTDDDQQPVSASGSESVAVTGLASSILVEKAADVSSVPEPGGPVTYTVTVTNTSAVDGITIDSVTDSVDGGSPFAAGGDCPGLVGDALEPGASTSCSFTLPVAGAPGDVVADTVTVSATDDDDGTVSGQASESVAITDVASSLLVTKDADVASVPEPGGPVTYTVGVTNTSAVDDVTIGSVTDSVDGGPAAPAGGTCPGLVGDVLEPGDSTSCSFTSLALGQAGDTVADTATVAGTDDDGTAVSAQASESVAITDVASSLAVTKVADVDAVPEPGGPVTYTVTATNTSAVDGITIGSVTDSVEGGAPFAAGGDCPDLVGEALTPGASASCSFTLAVTGGPGDVVDDTATVSGTDDDGGSVSASGSESVAVTGVGSSLQVTKVADVASVPEPGGPVTYTVTITNGSATDTVAIDSITDSVEGGAPFAAGGDCPGLVGDQLAPGDATSCSFALPVTGEPGDTVDDTVVVTGTDDDDDPVSAQASESVDVADVPASIAVTKVADVASVPEPGGPVTYTVTITNTSAVDSVLVDSVTDSVDGGSAFSPDGCGEVVGDLLAPKASTACSFTLDVTGGPGDVVADTVAVTGTDDDERPVSAEASESVAITDVLPSITVTKTASPSSVVETAPGETRTVTYTVGIQNDAAEPVAIQSIVDAVDGAPAAAVAGSCDDLVGTTLAAQAGTTCEFTMEVAGDAGDTTTDVVTVSAADDEQNPISDSDDATVTFTDDASALLVEKTANVGSVPEPGGPVTYSVSVTNASAVDSITIDSITDSVDGGAPFAAGGDCPALVGTTLAPGASDDCSFTLDVTGDAGLSVLDTVTVAGTDDDGAAVSATGDESVAITDVASGLAVTKVADVAAVPDPGGPVTYTVGITNTSTVDDVVIDSIVDSVDGGAPFAAGGDCAGLLGTNLDPGASASCAFTLDVTGQPGDVVADTVTVAGTDGDGAAVSGEGSETVDITDVGTTLLVTKQASVASVPEPGGPVTFTVGVTNLSTVDTVSITSITDSVSGGTPFPAGGTCPDLVATQLEPGASTSCAFTMDVAGGAGDVVSDTVTVVGDDGDPDPVPGAPTETAAKSGGLGGGTDPAPAPDAPEAGPARTVTGQASASVSIAGVAPTATVDKVATPKVVAEFGGPVSYGITVTNTSPSEAVTLTALTDAVGGASLDATAVTGPITATTCATGGVIAPGGTYSCAFTYAIPAGKPGDTVVDTITANLVDDDGDAVAPTDTETVTLVDVAPVITVDKSNGDAVLPAPGGDVDFTVAVTNPSAEPVTITSITDAVDGGTPFTVTGCAPGATIAPGASFTCTFRLAVTGDEAKTVVDEVVVLAVDDDGSPARAADTAVTRITASADVSITKRLAGPDLEPGKSGAYELVVANAGPSKAVDVQVVDTLPEGLTATAASGDGWTCGVEPRTVTCTRPELAAGQSSTITVSVDVSADVAGRSITNVADVTSTTDDPDLTNNHAEVTTDVGAVEPSEENPPPSGPGEPPAVGPADEGSGPLPRTGSDTGPLVRDGLLLVGLGALLLAARRFLSRRPAGA